MNELSSSIHDSVIFLCFLSKYATSHGYKDAKPDDVEIPQIACRQWHFDAVGFDQGRGTVTRIALPRCEASGFPAHRVQQQSPSSLSMTTSLGQKPGLASNVLASQSSSLTCTLVIPFYNEEESIQKVLTEACAAMEALHCEHEVIAVDDGSADSTRRKAESLKSEWPSLRILAFDQNRGQAAALLDGMRAARGQFLITMDGDGQNDPADISRLLDALRARRLGMVAGVRVERNDSWLRRRMSRLANAVRQRLLHDGVRDSGCALKVFRHEVCGAFIPIRTLYSFMPALAVAAGFEVGELEVNHRARLKGKSKYGLLVMLWRPMLDMFGVWWFARRRFREATPVKTTSS